MDDKVISTVALIHVQDCKALLVRPHQKLAFYLPGGKRDQGENDETALRREIREELGCSVGSLHGYDTFEDQAYGEPEGTRVRIACYFGELDRQPTPMGEIAEFAWFSHEEYAAMPNTAPAALRILLDLQGRALIS